MRYAQVGGNNSLKILGRLMEKNVVLKFQCCEDWHIIELLIHESKLGE